MDYSRYYCIRPSDLEKLEGLAAAERVAEAEGDWVYVVSDDEEVAKVVGLAVHFHNDEWASWGFTISLKGEDLLSGTFGENSEAGIYLEDNELTGDVAAAAAAIGVDAAALQAIIGGWKTGLPDIEAFAQLLAFDIVPITPDR